MNTSDRPRSACRNVHFAVGPGARCADAEAAEPVGGAERVDQALRGLRVEQFEARQRALAGVGDAREGVGRTVKARDIQRVEAKGRCLREQNVGYVLVEDAGREEAFRLHVPFIVRVDADLLLGRRFRVAARDRLRRVVDREVGAQVVKVRARCAAGQADAELHLVVDVPVNVHARIDLRVFAVGVDERSPSRRCGRRTDGGAGREVHERFARIGDPLDARAGDDIAPVEVQLAHDITSKDFLADLPVGGRVGRALFGCNAPGLEVEHVGLKRTLGVIAEVVAVLDVAEKRLRERERVLSRDRQTGSCQLRCRGREGLLLQGLDAVCVEGAGLELKVQPADDEVVADISLERIGARVCTAGTTRDAGQRRGELIDRKLLRALRARGWGWRQRREQFQGPVRIVDAEIIIHRGAGRGGRRAREGRRRGSVAAIGGPGIVGAPVDLPSVEIALAAEGVDVAVLLALERVGV